MFETLDIARLKYIMTMDCNFRCDYCYEGGKTNMNLDAAEAIRVGKQILDEMKQDELKVLYFGGEPFLRFQDMKIITQSLSMYAPRVGKRIVFTSITNGTIMNDEIVKHLNQYKYYMSISCDGIEDAQNTHRGFLNGMKTSFPMVERSIKLLLPATKNFCASMVVTDQNVKYLSQSFEWLSGLGVRNYAISPVLDQAKYTPDPEVYENQLKEVADIAAKLDGRVVINPPLDQTWDENNATRRMYRSEESVNIEVSPLGIEIIPERSLITNIDFGLENKIEKIPPTRELRDAIVNAERRASKYYADIKLERKDC